MRPKQTTKKTTKKDDTFVFEPVTDRQLQKIWVEASISGMTESEINAMIREVACLELATALSKQEADYIIKRIMGSRSKLGLLKPWKPRKASRIDYDTTALPRLYPMREIREFVVYLGWKPWELEAYLRKRHGASSLRDLDRAGANRMAWHLQQMLTGRAPRKWAR